MPRLVIATHGHCFDGLASATLFDSVYRQIHGEVPESEVLLLGFDYGKARQGIQINQLRGIDNAVLDYKYAALPQVTWYFDHHKSAFTSRHERQHFETKQRGAPKQFLFDPEYSSCAKLIADHAQKELGSDLSGFAELIEWADRVDQARFDSADAATDRSEPALQIGLVVEQLGASPMLRKLLSELRHKSLAEIAALPLVQDPLPKLVARYDKALANMRERTSMRGEVAFCNMTDAPKESLAKFGVYKLFPEATYSLIVSPNSAGMRVSIGYNPWSEMPRKHDIAAICQRFGGGGHPVVGSFSLRNATAKAALKTAETLMTELNR